MTYGITLMQPAIDQLSPAARAEIFSIIGLSGEAPQSSNWTPAEESNDDEVSPDQDDDFADLSPQQAKKFLEGTSDKSKRALRFMVSGDRKFKLAGLAKELGVHPTELPGLWSGLTKRTRTITGNKSAYLLYWVDDALVVDEEYLDQTGYMTRTTYSSFRHAFGLV